MSIQVIICQVKSQVIHLLSSQVAIIKTVTWVKVMSASQWFESTSLISFNITNVVQNREQSSMKAREWKRSGGYFLHLLLQLVFQTQHRLLEPRHMEKHLHASQNNVIKRQKWSRPARVFPALLIGAVSVQCHMGIFDSMACSCLTGWSQSVPTTDTANKMFKKLTWCIAL